MSVPDPQPSHERDRTRLPGVAFAVLALVLLAAACGSDDSSSGAEAEPAGTTVADETTTTDSTEEGTESDDAVADAAPSRIVSLSPAFTEVLFAIGAGDQVIAVDSLSNFPPEAPMTELSAFEPSLEAIAAEEPDLVVLSYDPTGDLVSGLEGLGVAVFLRPDPATLDDAYASIADLGIVTGQIDGAATVVADMRSAFDEIAASVPTDGEPIRIYHELDESFYSASSGSFIGDVYNRLNVVNIADEADTDGYGYPQLSAEYILEADPQLIVITDEVGYTVDDVAARPGWDAIAAVANGNVISVDSDIASRGGPRLPQFLEVIAAAVAGASVGR